MNHPKLFADGRWPPHNPGRMTLTELKYIVAVARERHFGRAAEACFVSQPTLSVAIRKLEDELGVTLFERGGAEVGVTPIGQRIVAQAQKVLEESASIRRSRARATIRRRAAARGRDPYHRSLPAAAGARADPSHAADAAATAGKLHRARSSCCAGRDRLRHHGLAFAGGRPVMQPLYDEPFVVAVPNDHELAKQAAVDAQDLKQQTMLLLGSGHCFRDRCWRSVPSCRAFPRPATASSAPSRARRWKRSATWWRRASASPCCR